MLPPKRVDAALKAKAADDEKALATAREASETALAAATAAKQDAAANAGDLAKVRNQLSDAEARLSASRKNEADLSAKVTADEAAPRCGGRRRRPDSEARSRPRLRAPSARGREGRRRRIRKGAGRCRRCARGHQKTSSPTRRPSSPQATKANGQLAARVASDEAALNSAGDAEKKVGSLSAELASTQKALEAAEAASKTSQARCRIRCSDAGLGQGRPRLRPEPACRSGKDECRAFRQAHRGRRRPQRLDRSGGKSEKSSPPISRLPATTSLPTIRRR